MARRGFVIPCDGCNKPVEHGVIGIDKLPMRCSRCKCVFYHNRDCQRAHYKEHKHYCRAMASKVQEGSALLLQPTAASDLKGLGKESGDEECGICLQQMHTDNKIPASKDCVHAFHHGCLAQWQAHGTGCPLCRSEMPADLLHDKYADVCLLVCRANARFQHQSHKETFTTSIASQAATESATNADFVAAMQQVEELLTLEPNHRGCLMLKSELLFYMREFDEAILQTQSFTQQETHLNTRIEASCLQKKRAVESQLIAKCYMRLKDWNLAVGYWREGFSGLGHGPEDAKEVRESLHGMVTCYYHQGEYAKAISLSDGAIEMNRHYDGVYDHRALAQEALGDLDGAISTLEQAVAYEAPWDPKVHTRQKERLAGLRARKVEEQGCSSPSSRPANSASATGRIVIPVSDAEELQAAAARIASSPSVPYKIQIAGGEYEIPGEDVPGVGMAIVIGGDDVVLEGIGMNRQSSVKRGEDKSKNSQLNVKVLVTASRKFEMAGLTCTKGIFVRAPACQAVFRLVHVDGNKSAPNEDAFVLEQCRTARLDGCEVFGGSDGLMISDGNCECYIKDSDIRFAASRGIFANPHFTVEDVEVSCCGSYGMKTRGGCTRIGDNDIQPGPWG